MALLAGPLGGWLADRIGRDELGRAVRCRGTGPTDWAGSRRLILLFWSVMSLGTALFVAAKWAATADVVPREEAGRFFGLANVGTMGAAAVPGLLGLLVDIGNGLAPGAGYVVALAAAALAALAALAVVRRLAARSTSAGSSVP